MKKSKDFSDRAFELDRFRLFSVWAIAPQPSIYDQALGYCTIKLWDIAQHPAADNFEPACQTLEGHTGWVVSIAFSPDGETLASCSIDGTIRLWEVETGKCLTILTVDRPYEGLNITGVTGISEAEKATLCALGAAIDEKSTEGWFSKKMR